MIAIDKSARRSCSVDSCAVDDERQLSGLAVLILRHTSGQSRIADLHSEIDMASSATQQLLTLWSERYRDALLKFFQRRMPPTADREDLVQEVFLHMARQHDLSSVRDVEAFLFHAASNVLKDWRRKQLTHASDRHDSMDESSDEVVGLEAVGRTPEHVLLGKEALERLIAALELLPERTRTIFVLYHFEQMPHAQIARDLGIAVRTVEDHVARANEKLLISLKDLL